MKKKFILPIVTLVLTLFGLGSCQFITHDHNYGDTWSHDDTHHWKVCTVEGCGRVSFKDEHVGGTATETEKAKCSVCGEILTAPDDFSAVREALEAAKVPMASAEVTMIPQNWVELTSEDDIKKMNRILDLLDEDDDVQNVYHNWDE